MPLRRKIALFLFLPLALLILVSLIYVLLVGEAILSGEDVIGCAFKHTFFLYCPGCGGSRSLIALLSFNFIESFIFFPALPISVLILCDLYVRAVISFVKNDEKYLKGFKSQLLIIIPAVIILNFFVRNILLLSGIDLLGDFIK